MCGRSTLKTPIDTPAKRFGIAEYPSSIPPSYNMAPTQTVATVVVENGKRKLEMFRCGLIPSWAKDPEIGNWMINARAERVARREAYAGAPGRQQGNVRLRF